MIMQFPVSNEHSGKKKSTNQKKKCASFHGGMAICVLLLCCFSSKLVDAGPLRRSVAEKLEPTSPNDIMIISFYYPWYEESDWCVDDMQGSYPMLGFYGSDDQSIAEKHVDWAVDRGGIDAWAVSWSNRKNPSTEMFVQGMLRARNIDKIKFCMLYETLGALPIRDFANGTLAIDRFIADMEYVRNNYFSHPSYLHINNRPVVYVYLARDWGNFTSEMLETVKKRVGQDILFIADIPFYGINRDPHSAVSGIMEGKPIFEAYTSYNMYEARLVQKGESATDYMLRESLPIFERWSNETVFFPHVLPKYHDYRNGHPKLVGDSAGLLKQLETFACLPRPSWYFNEIPNLLFVTTFNEWWEGSAIEPDIEEQYGFSFLDTIKAFKYSTLQCPEEPSE